MNERLYARLAARLQRGPQVLASVLTTRGATPRKAGACMLIDALDTEFSIGGGLAEARVWAAAQDLLASDHAFSEVQIELNGQPGSAGVCGGQMQLALRRWDSATDRARAEELAATLAQGQSVQLSASDAGHELGAVCVEPDPRLLIVGGGHCGQALYELARYLDFEQWVFDPRPEYADPARFPGAHCLSGDHAVLGAALATPRALYAVLLNRDFHSDVATLRAIAGARFAFLGMMGSQRRIRQVLAALPEQADALSALQAPVGIEIEAETPHEIAISILAHLIQTRRACTERAVR